MRRAAIAVLVTLLVVAAPAVGPVTLAAADDRNAGPPTDRWSTTVGGDDDDKLAAGIRVDGGYLVVGWSNSSTDDVAHDGYVAKVSRTGAVEWERTYGDRGTDKLFDVASTGDGYLVAGMATAGPDDTWQGWVMKLGPDGEKQWERTYGEGDPSAFWSLAASDGRIYVGGWKRGVGDSTKGWAMELRTHGDPVWSETYSTSYSGNEYVNSVFATEDGDLLMTGSITDSGSDPSDAWVLEVGGDGDQQWSRIYGGAEYDRVHDAAATPDGGYVLAGRTGSHGADDRDGWLLKVGADGDQQWDRTYGTSRHDAFFGIHSDSDGGYVLAGTQHVLGENGGDGWVVKTDGDGDRQWGTTYGAEYWDKFWPVVAGHGGGYLAIGESTSFGDDRDGWLVRIGGPSVAAFQDTDDSGATVQFSDAPVRAVTLADANVSGTNASGVLSVAERANYSALSPPGDPVSAVTMNASGVEGNATATVEFAVRTDAVAAELSDLRVARQTDDGWEILPTSVVSDANGTAAANGTVVLTADAPVDSTLVVTAVAAPTASVEAPEVVTVGESVELSAAGSVAENGTLVGYEWAVGGESLSGRTATVTFDSPGERTVNLSVTDENGLRDAASAALVVNDRPAVSVDAPDAVTVGSAGTFTADVTDEVGDVTVTWQFGDAEVTGESVEHSFGSPGTETVVVVVEDEYGATTTAEIEVQVRAQDDSDDETTTVTTTTGTETSADDSSRGIPGFGVTAAVVALLGAALLASHRS